MCDLRTLLLWILLVQAVATVLDNPTLKEPAYSSWQPSLEFNTQESCVRALEQYVKEHGQKKVHKAGLLVTLRYACAERFGEE